MKEISSYLSSIKFKSQSSVENGLKTMKIPVENFPRLIADSFSLSEKKGNMIVMGLISLSPDLKSHGHILSTIRKMENPSVRHGVVKTYWEKDKKMELITGLSSMTTKDATLFFKDYFDVGGTTKDVTSWIENISNVYIAKKRLGQIDPEFDGFWGDVWDAACDAAGAIYGAIATVVDAVIEAGKVFCDIVGDIIEYSQNRINDIIELLIDAGREIGEFIAGVVEGIASAVTDGFTKVFKAILAAGKLVLDILNALYDKVVDYVKDGIEVLISIGCRIKDILSSAMEMAVEKVKDVIGFIVDLGHSVWYILKWAFKKTFEIIKATFEKFLEIGQKLGDLIAWCVRRSLGVLKKGFEILLEMGNTFRVIIETLITDPRNVFKKGFQALKELGASIYDFVNATLTLGIDIMKRTFNTLKEIGLSLIDFLEYGLSQGYDIFKEIGLWLLGIGVKVFDILIWAIGTSVEIFGWALKVINVVAESFTDIIEWIITDIGGEWLGHLAHWLAETAKTAVDWFKDKVIQPILAVGKLAFVIILAGFDIVFLAISYYALKSLVDNKKTDYKNWPSTLDEFKNKFKNKLAILPDVDENHKYVIVSDEHKESREDIENGIGHFYKNKELYLSILNKYSLDSTWAIITAGDDEEFWYSADLEPEADSINKVQPIIDNNKEVFDSLSNNFYKNRNPRRFIKIRGNHDDIWKSQSAVNKLTDDGFPGIEVYEYATFKRNGRDTLVMHGHQFDQYNCDANNFFGKFTSNFVGESIDALNETLVSLFGESARIEGWTLAPFSKRSEWEGSIDSSLANPELSSGMMFDERVVKDTIKGYDCNLIMGHTHDAKILKDPEEPDRFYANSGTCGWWEDCVWSLEITANEVVVKAWTPESTESPFRSLALSDTATF